MLKTQLSKPQDNLNILATYEQLVLYPTPTRDENHANYESNNTHQNSVGLHQEIARRINLFRSGQIQQLYEESRQVASKTPQSFAENPVKIQKNAHCT